MVASCRVLHVLARIDPACGGPVAAIRGLALAQRAIGLDVRITATRAADRPSLSLAEELRASGIATDVIGLCRGPFLSHPRIKPRLREAVEMVDIVHIHGMWTDVIHHAAEIAHVRNKPFVITPHGMLDPWALAQNRWRKKLLLAVRFKRHLNRAVSLHFTAEAERDLTRPLKLTAPAIAEPNGLDLDEFETLPPPGSFRMRYPAIGQRPIILFMSRLHAKKGLDHLLPAFAKANLQDAVLVIAGPDSGGYRATVEKLVRDHGLDDRVLFTGMLHGRDRVAALADADLFALTSYQENFGIVVIEALAAGTPVLISDQVNIHDRITSAGVGQVVPMDVDFIARELARWMNDAALRHAAASKAGPFVWANYDWDAIARRWLEHYRSMLGLRPLNETRDPRTALVHEEPGHGPGGPLSIRPIEGGGHDIETCP